MSTVQNRLHYPIAVIEDRYGGCYSGGRWLAIGCADRLENGAYRVVRCLEDGPYGEDTEAMDFWADPPSWIAVGASPEEAIQKLNKRVEDLNVGDREGAITLERGSES